jgi:hypothetical protein
MKRTVWVSWLLVGLMDFGQIWLVRFALLGGVLCSTTPDRSSREVVETCWRASR